MPAEGEEEEVSWVLVKVIAFFLVVEKEFFLSFVGKMRETFGSKYLVQFVDLSHVNKFSFSLELWKHTVAHEAFL